MKQLQYIMASVRNSQKSDQQQSSKNMQKQQHDDSDN
jgi:hypothetical protein